MQLVPKVLTDLGNFQQTTTMYYPAYCPVLTAWPPPLFYKLLYFTMVFVLANLLKSFDRDMFI